MREVLQRLFRQEDPPRRFMTVVSVLPDGRYVTVDDRARTLTVDGAAGYLPGNAVIVQGGRIVGLGSRRPATKNFKV
jgi:hypothetical protein